MTVRFFILVCVPLHIMRRVIFPQIVYNLFGSVPSINVWLHGAMIPVNVLRAGSGVACDLPAPDLLCCV